LHNVVDYILFIDNTNSIKYNAITERYSNCASQVLVNGTTAQKRKNIKTIMMVIMKLCLHINIIIINLVTTKMLSRPPRTKKGKLKVLKYMPRLATNTIYIYIYNIHIGTM